MKTKHIITVVFGVIIALITYKLFTNKKELNKKNQPAPVIAIAIPVKTAVAKEQSLEVSIVKTGYIAPFREVKAIATANGTLQQVRFNLGDQVYKGQVLAVIDTRALALDLQNAMSAATKLEKDLEVYTELLKGKAATQDKVNEVRQNYLDAVNKVDQLRKEVADADIKAPNEGIVSAKPLEQGVWITAGTEVVTIVDLSKAKVRVNLTESEVYQVTKGQSIKITADVYPGKIFHGTVTFISPQSDEVHNYLVEAEVDHTQQSLLRSGTFVQVDFSKMTDKQVLLIPREALTQSTKSAAVYVVENNIAHWRDIQTGQQSGSMIQVTNGLRAGEQLVVSGQINLKEGSPVSISK